MAAYPPISNTSFPGTSSLPLMKSISRDFPCGVSCVSMPGKIVKMEDAMAHANLVVMRKKYGGGQ